MRISTRMLVPAALSLALFAGACGDQDAGDDTLAVDTALTRDLELANRDTALQPELQDVPAETPPATAPAPTRTAPRTPRTTPRAEPAPSRPTTTPSGNVVERETGAREATVASIPAGTAIGLTANDRVCTNTHRVGDRFTATVENAVVGANGAVIPAGAKVVLQVTELDRSENVNDPIRMTFNVVSVSYGGKSYPIQASIEDVNVEKVRAASTGSDAKKVIGGAVAGAIIGQIIGKNTKSTVIGAATGAAAGTAVAMGTANYEGCIPQGGAIQIKLTQPAVVQAE